MRADKTSGWGPSAPITLVNGTSLLTRRVQGHTTTLGPAQPSPPPRSLPLVIRPQVQTLPPHPHPHSLPTRRLRRVQHLRGQHEALGQRPVAVGALGVKDLGVMVEGGGGGRRRWQYWTQYVGKTREVRAVLQGRGRVYSSQCNMAVGQMCSEPAAVDAPPTPVRG